MGEFGFLQDLVMVMVVAAVATIAAYRLNQPVVLGYILAGLAIGPHAPSLGLVQDQENIRALADFGIIFLMFALGLEFNLKKLRGVGPALVLAAIIQIGAMIAIGYYLGIALGWSAMDAIFLGAIISMSSTVIIVKMLMEAGRMSESFASVALGILIIEDLAAVVIVALLGGVASADGMNSWEAAKIVLNIAVFIAVSLAVGLVVVPRLIDWVSRFHVEEVLVTTVVGLALGYALLAVKLGFSMALGAFIMGAIIAESRAVERVEHKITPLRDMFTAVFFVAVGMLIDIRVIAQYFVPILIISATAIAGKLVMNVVAGTLAGTRVADAARAGLTLAVIGEFSFIIAAMGANLGVTSAFLHPIAVAVCVITSLINPYLLRSGDGWLRRAERAVPDRIQDAAEAHQSRMRRLFRREGLNDPDAAGRGTRVIVYASWLLGLLLAAAGVSAWIARGVNDTLSLGENVERSLTFTLVILAGLPLFYAFTRSVEGIAHASAKKHAMTPYALARADAFHRTPKIVSRAIAILAAAGLLTGALALAWDAHPFALPDAPWIAGVALVLAVVAYFSWRRLAETYVAMERLLDNLWAPDGEPEANRMLKRVKQSYPWGVDILEHQVSHASSSAYQSLRDLRVRERTGANILSIERAGSTIVNPNPHLALIPGDKVYLVGKRDQLEGARLHLRGERIPSPPSPRTKTEEVRLPPSSPWVGSTVAEARVDYASGAQLTGIRRADGFNVPAAPHEKLEAGDTLLITGEPEAIERARDHLRARDPRTLRAHPYYDAPVGANAGFARSAR